MRRSASWRPLSAAHPAWKYKPTPTQAGAEHYRKTGEALPRDVLQSCLQADAVLLAAIGLPDVRKPDGLYLVQNPSAYDVLAMENQFGDILSDLAARIVGGLGLAPSAEIGDDHALFQPSHGSAPQLAGKNVANPIATILSAAMMFDWLAERHQDRGSRQAAERMEAAVKKVLAAGRALTADLGGRASTGCGRDCC